ncbi:MAG: DNA gyrase inhibitor YacG [Pseudomonadota bacterium]|nr:DNA gyrase inhibitor YacG [Pseudomonadota bacterium]MEC8370171.1 DNA gyrase inhibitor YacG [Pseudomonadota bacterium]
MTDSRCPQCDKPTVERFRPFCSKRCADLDLGSWLNGAYRIETEEEVEIEEYQLLSPHIENF